MKKSPKTMISQKYDLKALYSAPARIDKRQNDETFATIH